jgi:2,4'-dihydroxyacetophenone dioxygenase
MHTVADTTKLDWIPLSPGLSFKPLTYLPGGTGYQILLKIEPGTLIPLHRHTGEIHAFNLSGRRLLIEDQRVVEPGNYVYEPAGNVDSWKAVGDEPCVVHVEVNGRIEYLGPDGQVTRFADAGTSLKTYLDWCAKTGTPVDPAIHRA